MHSREIIMFVAFDMQNYNNFIDCSQKLHVISHVVFLVDYLLVCSEVSVSCCVLSTPWEHLVYNNTRDFKCQIIYQSNSLKELQISFSTP